MISVPLVVSTSKNKKFILNLNNYRNAHHFILNTAKVKFKEMILEKIYCLPEFKNKIKITYTLFPGSHRKLDLSNVFSIVDKFFCDALTEAKKLPDDNYNFIPEVVYKFGEIDVNNPRVEINIEEIK